MPKLNQSLVAAKKFLSANTRFTFSHLQSSRLRQEVNTDHWRSQREGIKHLFPSSGSGGSLSILHETLPVPIRVSIGILHLGLCPVLAKERVVHGATSMEPWWVGPDLIISGALRASGEVSPGSETEHRGWCRSWELGDRRVAGGGLVGGRVVAILVEGLGEEVLEGDSSFTTGVAGGSSDGGARARAGMVKEGGEVDLLPDLFHGPHALVGWGRRGGSRLSRAFGIANGGWDSRTERVRSNIMVLWVIRNT